MENAIHPLKGLEGAEILQQLLCTWLPHGPHGLNELAAYFSGCPCVNDFAEGFYPFYFWSMWELIIEATMN